MGMFDGLFNQKKYVVQEGAWGTPQQPPQQFPQQYPQQQYSQQGMSPQAQTPLQPTPVNPGSAPVNSGLGSTMQPEKREEISALSHLDARTTTILAQAQQETIRIKQS